MTPPAVGGAIRAPYRHGQFYEADPAELAAQIQGCFSHRLGPGLPRARPPPRGSRTLRGLVVPHAGYHYSGLTAAHGYAALAHDGLPEVAVIIGPNHTGEGVPVAVSPEYYRTPLGDAGMASDVILSLVRDLPGGGCRLDTKAHLREHSVEVQVPFLQWLGGSEPAASAIVPIVLGAQHEAAAVGLGRAVAEAVAGLDAVVIASTDFCHYLPDAETRARDAHALAAIAALDVGGLYDALEEYGISMCGFGAAAATLTAAMALGADQGRQLHYSTSGDAPPGDRDRVVGYGALALAASGSAGARRAA